MNVGMRIKMLRESRGMTVNRLANSCGVSQSYLRDLELGKKQPTVEYLGYICEGLGITLRDFFDFEDGGDRLELAVRRLTTEQRQKLVDFIESL